MVVTHELSREARNLITESSPSRPVPNPKVPCFVNQAEAKTFTNKFDRAWVAIKKKYQSSDKGTRRDPLTEDEFQELYGSAAYVNALGIDPKLVIATMCARLGEEKVRSLELPTNREVKPSDLGQIGQIVGKYREIIHDDSTNTNVRMATATNDFPALQASIIRATQLMHSIHRREDSHLSLIRDLYLPLFYNVIHLPRLANDLGDEFVHRTDPTAYANIRRAIDENTQVVSRHMPTLVDYLRKRLSGEGVTVELRRNKSVFSTHLKVGSAIKEKPGQLYTLDEIPDLGAVRLIVDHPAEMNEEELEQKMNTVHATVRTALEDLERTPEKRRFRDVVPFRIRLQRFNITNRIRKPARSGFRGSNFPFRILLNNIALSRHNEVQVTARRWHDENEYGVANRIGFKSPNLNPDTVQRLLQVRRVYESSHSLNAVNNYLSQ